MADMANFYCAFEVAAVLLTPPFFLEGRRTRRALRCKLRVFGAERRAKVVDLIVLFVVIRGGVAVCVTRHVILLVRSRALRRKLDRCDLESLAAAMDEEPVGPGTERFLLHGKRVVPSPSSSSPSAIRGENGASS